MKPCPACQREVQDEASECPFCGVVFAKWKGNASVKAVNPLAQGPVADKSTTASQKQRGFFSTCILVLSDPARFFKDVKESGNIKQARWFTLKVLSLGYAVVMIELWKNGHPPLIEIFTPVFLMMFVSFGSLLLLVFILTFMLAGFYHMCVKFLRGKGSYADSYHILPYGAILPGTLGFLASGVLNSFIRLLFDSRGSSFLILIPIAGLVWGLYNMSIGGSILHRISMKAAAFAAVFYLLMPVSLISYPSLKIQWAKHQAESLCAEAVIGGPVEGLEAKARDLGLRVISQPAGWYTDPKNPPPARISAWEGWIFARWFCDIEHADGKVIQKHTFYLD